jgi:hypothetical protein
LPCSRSMLDGLRQTHIGRHHERGTSTLPRVDRLAIGSSEDGRIAEPSITAPRQRMALCAGEGEGHRSLDQIGASASSCAGSDEAAGTILHETSEAVASIGFAGSPVFFARRRTKTRRFRPSRGANPDAQRAVKASACSLARRSHSPIVSYLWPVISWAARKLPRRITIKSAWATRCGPACAGHTSVCLRSRPQKRPHPRQW